VKLSDLTPEQWHARLSTRRSREADTIQSWWQYYDGEQPLYFVAKILEEQQNRFPPLTINWCEKFADSIDRRCVVEGFRLRGEDDLSDALWDVWQRNDLDEDQSENNIASLVTGVSYVMVGPDDDGQALVTVESPDSVTVEIDPRTRRVIAALKVWKSDPESQLEDMSELYVPGRIIPFEDGKQAGSGQRTGWMKGLERVQTSPEVPVVPFMNRRRRNVGRSELRALKPVVDAANQVATNMLAAVEHHAVPRKWILGASKENFLDKDGNALPAWKIATGAVWVNPFDPKQPEAKPEIGQFAASDLRHFHETISLLGRIGSGLCDMPPNEFGFGVADNPASADGINAAKESFTRRVETVLTARGSAYEKVMRLAAAVEDNDPKKMVHLETVWRDPGTPTRQAKAQTAVATYGSGLSDLRQAREDYGYTRTQIKDMETREEDADDALLASRLGGAPEVTVADASDLKAKADSMGVLIRAGVDPKSAAAQVGLAGVKFTGAVPVSLRLPEDQASKVEGK
jgi:hypothetical protein